MSGKSALKCMIPSKEIKSTGSAEEVYNTLLDACSKNFTPAKALEMCTTIQRWAGLETNEDVFRLIFDVDRTFGGFCAIWFKMHPVYYVPIVDKMELASDAKSPHFTPSTLDALVSLVQKVSLALVALDCIKFERTGRPLEHMLPSDIGEKRRCKNLYEVVLCVWTRMCHVWGIVRYGGEEFLCKELSCFPIGRGEGKSWHLWFDVNVADRSCTLVDSRWDFDTLVQVRVMPDERRFTFSTKTNRVASSSEGALKFLAILFDDEDEEGAFKLLPGEVAGPDCFVLITTGGGAFRGFYRIFGGVAILRYPIMFHPRVSDMLEISPRTDVFVDLPLYSCLACGAHSHGTYCSEECAATKDKK